MDVAFRLTKRSHAKSAAAVPMKEVHAVVMVATAAVAAIAGSTNYRLAI
jgi:hypothetical protein